MESILRIPQPQHQPRLSPPSLPAFPISCAAPRLPFDLGDSRIWNEHHWQHTICGGAAFGCGDSRIWNERDVAHLMHAEFGLELDLEEARARAPGTQARRGRCLVRGP